MRAMLWWGVVLVSVCAIGAYAGEGKKEKKSGKGANTATAPAPGTVSGTAAANPGSAQGSSGGKTNKPEKKSKDERAADKAARDAEEAKEAGGDQPELATLSQTLGLSDEQKKEIGKAFEKYRARLAEIKGLPDKSPNEKLLKGPQRRALRDDLGKWVKEHVSPGQAQKFDVYEKKRRRDLYDERVNNRVTRLGEAVGLNENQRSKIHTIYDVQMAGVQNAADALYAATQKQGGSTADLEKNLEDKRQAMRRAVEGVLKPDQIEKYKAVDD